jgi:hypothetical protein
VPWAVPAYIHGAGSCSWVVRRMVKMTMPTLDYVPDFDKMFMSTDYYNDWIKGYDQILTQVKAVYVGVKIFTTDLLPYNKILLVKGKKVVAVVDFE